MLIGTIIGILVGSIFNLDVSVTTAFGMIVGYLFGLMMFMY
ncbi:hypothetical protein MEPL8_2c02240 [Melissococcus plutonius]|nr:hypothetical protein MEPL8_2c02240 [Melissococcus plutonius]